MEIVVRPCFQQDLELVQIIYAHHVMTGTGTFETTPPTLEEMAERWTRVVAKGWPYLVACPTTDLTRVLGFAYAQQFRDREAYAKSFEDSVYVAPTSVRQGVGKALLGHLLHQLHEDGAREVIAVIGDADNAGSIRLHAGYGFVQAGLLRRVGNKFDRWLDVVLMQRSLPDSPGTT
ncbi:MAG: N-acetyltransferase [Hyphomonadaceae bacterium]|nr:N-acetyltransferase [Hyphomonadaceae bacterium]